VITSTEDMNIFRRDQAKTAREDLGPTEYKEFGEGKAIRGYSSDEFWIGRIFPISAVSNRGTLYTLFSSTETPCYYRKQNRMCFNLFEIFIRNRTGCD
jgi:hypothetical protein